MLVMIDKRNPNRKHEDEKVDALLEKARAAENGRILFEYRKRIAYDQYLIQIWDAHPTNEKARAKMVWEIYGVKRRHIKEMKEFPKPEPRRPIIKDGKPVKGNGPQLSILKGT